MVRFNPLAVAKLKRQNQQPTSTGDIFCYLEIEGSQERFDFILNPSSIDQSVASNYETLPSAGTNVPRLQFRYGDALEIKLNGLMMVSPQHQSSLKPLLDAAVALTRCDPANKKYSQPVCRFVWGSRVIESCIVKSFDFTEKMWNTSGEPIHVEASMALREVISEKTSTVTQGSTQTTEPKLTTRELEKGSKEAIDWLKVNPLSVPKEVQQRVKTGQYRIKTDPNSKMVSVTDSTGKTLATIGANNRGVFKPK